MSSDRSNWVRFGNKLVNPDNALGVGVAMAGTAARNIGYSRKKPADERPVVSAAEAKRMRRLANRLENSKLTCYTCARPVAAGVLLCEHCTKNHSLVEGTGDET